MDIDGECPFRSNDDETINHHFMNYDSAFNVWSTIESYCPIPINTNLPFVECLNLSGLNKSWYNKIFR